MIPFVYQIINTCSLFWRSKKFSAILLSLGTLFVLLSLMMIVILHSYTYNEEFSQAERHGSLQKSQNVYFNERVDIHLVRSQNTTVLRKHKGVVSKSIHSMSELDSFPLKNLDNIQNVSPLLNTTELRAKMSSIRKASKSRHSKFNRTAYNLAKERRVPKIMPVILEPNLSPIKGFYVNYTNQYVDGLTTSGSYFKYLHNYSTPCYLNSISLKYDPLCGDAKLPISSIRQVLVVAVQRSGTHFTWEMLNRLNITVHHEGVGAHGAVGWPFSVRSTTTKRDLTGSLSVAGFARGYIINNPEKLRNQKFRYVFHQVRHPLRVISTLMSRCSTFDKFWGWIAKIKLPHFDEMNKDSTPLTRAMLLYYYWNRHIEAYADLRFQTETTSPRDICTWAKFNHEVYCNRNVTLIGEEHVRSSSSEMSAISRRLADEIGEKEEEEEEDAAKEEDDPSNNNSTTVDSSLESNDRTDIQYLKVTWTELDAENRTLSGWIKDMCVEYGFPLDPELIPQNRLSRQFTA